MKKTSDDLRRASNAELKSLLDAPGCTFDFAGHGWARC
jgi:hypothetical protein